jgi:hypothetical protein
VNKEMQVRMVEHAVRMGIVKSPYKNVTEKPEGNRSLVTQELTVQAYNNIKPDHKT